MKLILSTLAVLAITSSANASEIATYRGPIYKSGDSALVGQGSWLSVSSACANYVNTTVPSRGFAAAVSPMITVQDCKDAVVSIDLEGSSLCKGLGGPEMFYAPTVVTVQCLQ